MKRQIWYGKFREEIYPGYPKEEMAIEIGLSHNISTRASQEDVVRGGIIAIAPGHDWIMTSETEDVEPSSSLSSLVADIEAEGDEYARTVIPLIERMLADDYSQTDLFAEIGVALDKVEGKGPAQTLACGHVYSPEATCQRPSGHSGDHACEVPDVDPETRLSLGRRTVRWPNT